jgi:hypothetical protein
MGRENYVEYWWGIIFEKKKIVHLKERGDGRATRKWVLVGMGGGWNWLRFMSNGRLWY